MKYLVLVSHGKFAEGLKNTLSMFAGQREDVIAAGLLDNATAEQFAVTFEEIIQPITAEDEIVVLADIVGGSPLTTALNVLGNKGYLANTVVMGGMNLPLALTTVLMKDNLPNDVLVPTALGEATTALQQFVLATSNDDEDEI